MTRQHPNDPNPKSRNRLDPVTLSTSTDLRDPSWLRAATQEDVQA
jgi:hypothetical protein